MPAKTRITSRSWIWIVAAFVVLVGIYLVVRGTQTAVVVRTAAVDRHDLISAVSTNGKVEPAEDFQAHAPAPGMVQKLLVSVGQRVTRGQELLRLDASDAASKVATAQAAVTTARTGLANMQHGGTHDELITQRADLTSAEQQQKTAAAQLATLQALAAKGDASAAEVTQAQQRLADLNVKVEQLRTRETSRYSTGDLAAQRAQLSQSQASLAAAQSDYAGVDIRAPFAGTVYSLPVNQYDYVNAGEALLDIADMSKLVVRAYFDEPEIGKLSAGQPVKIVWEARPNRIWHGHVQQPPTTVITYGTRNVGECLITVDDANGDLLPNTNVTVTVTTSQHLNVLSLPREALRPEGGVNYVYRVVDNKLVRTPVQVGNSNLTRIEIVSGLKEGDTVALGTTTADTDLRPGLRVKMQPQQ